MRQAGRYMAEYRAIREKNTLLEICAQPELAAEVTLQPVVAHHVDAAILFADILLPLDPMGASFEFAKGEGPVIHQPIRNRADVERLQVIDAEQELSHIMEAIRISKRELAGKTPLIGFAGAPFTLASYLVEGGKSSNYLTTKSLMYAEPKIWHALLEKLAEVVRRYLVAQVKAGADAVQLFDSWVGSLAPSDYEEYVLPHVKHILGGVADLGVPVIHFGTGTGSLLELMQQAGGTVIGVDWRLPLDVARKRLGPDTPLQGNLDPTLLLAPKDVLERKIADVLKRAGGPHIFNVGHGIVPSTPPENVRLAVELVHRLSQR
jgi:uroporphyrinogen decarboxylase